MSQFIRGLDGVLYQVDIEAGGLGQIITPVTEGTPSAGGQPVATITPKEIVKRALRKIGVLASGETPGADMIQDGLSDLNAMLDAWSADGAMVYASTPESFSLSSGKQTYTIGAGGDFDTTRPSRIEFGTISLNGVELMLKGPVSTAEWAGSYKSLIGMPFSFWYNATSPLGEVRFDATPAQTYPLNLYTSGQLARVALNDTMSLPPAYEDALVYNLAVRMAPEYPAHKDLTVVATLAQESKIAVKRLNQKPIVMNLNERYRRPDIYSGTIR